MSFNDSSPRVNRRGDIDWLRGVAVLIMIEAHIFDSWMSAAAKAAPIHRYLVILAGIGAPLFLMLAGMGVVLSANAKARRTSNPAAAAAAVHRRGWWIFGLAFLFRIQSYLVNRGSDLEDLLKVDILNILGLGMAGAALVWGFARTPRQRFAAYVGVTAAIAFSAPIVRTAPLDFIPGPPLWYLQPAAGKANFTLFPWVGFVFAGGAAGVLIDQLRDPVSQRRLAGWFAAAGAALVVIGYSASFLPPIYSRASFWTTSPTYFAVRVGVMALALAAAWMWDQRKAPRAFSPLQQLGRSSLFIYWIHVELVYGLIAMPFKGALSLAQTTLAYIVFTTLMLGASLLKDWLMVQRRHMRPERVLKAEP